MSILPDFIRRPASPVLRPHARRRVPTRLGLDRLEARECLSGGYLAVADSNRDAVRRFDGGTGAFVDTLVPKHRGGMNQPWGLLFGPDSNGDGGRDLYVSTGQFGGPGQPKAVLRYDGATGDFIDAFTQGGDLASPRGIILGPDGDLFVADRRHIGKDWALESRIARFDGDTGAYLGDFVPLGGGGLQVAEQIVFGPSVEDPDRLDLYAVSLGNDSVKRYHGQTGAFLGDYIPSGGGGLEGPVTMTFTPDGDLLVADFYSSDPAVKRFQGPDGPTPGALLGTFVPAGSGGLRAPSGMVYGPDGNGDGHPDLYLAETTSTAFLKAGVKRYDGVTGDYIDDFVPERGGDLEGAVMIAFTETDPVTFAYTPVGADAPGRSAWIGDEARGRGDGVDGGVGVYIGPGVAADGAEDTARDALSYRRRKGRRA